MSIFENLGNSFREANIEQKWEESGLLGNFSEDKRKELIKIFENTEAKIADKDYAEELIIILFPAIRSIYSLINCTQIDGCWSHEKFKDNPELQKETSESLDGAKIAEELNTFRRYFMVFGELYLENLDHEAELVVLFCNNYVAGL